MQFNLIHEMFKNNYFELMLYQKIDNYMLFHRIDTFSLLNGAHYLSNGSESNLFHLTYYELDMSVSVHL